MERVDFSVGKNVLLPASPEANAVMAKLKVGETVACELYRARDKTVAAKVQFVFEAIAKAHGMRVRNVRGWIAAATGRADAVEINGIMAVVPHGTGPRDMKGDEFEAFWLDAREVIVKEILPVLTPPDAEAIRVLVNRVLVD